MHTTALPPLARLAAYSIAAALSVGPVAAPAQTENPFAAVVTVNEDIITGYEVDQLVKFNAVNLNRSIDAELEREVIDYLIDTRVVARAAAAVGLQIDDDAVDSQLAEIAAATDSTVPDMIAEYGDAGVDEDTLRSVIRGQLLWERLLRGRHGRQALEEIDPAAVQERIAEYEREQWVEHRLFRISLGVIDDSEEAKTRAENLTLSVRRRLADGEHFADLAKRVSRAQDAERGGEIGWRRDSALDDQLRQLINRMPVGAVSAPIYLNDGETIIVHVGDRTVRTPSVHIEPWQFDLRQIHYPLSEDVTEEVATTALERIEQFRSEATDCDVEPSEDLPLEFDRETGLTLAEIGYGLRPQVLVLADGDATEIVQRPDGYWYVHLCGRTGGITDAGREAVTTVARDSIAQERLTKLGEVYLKELRGQATIEYKSQ